MKIETILKLWYESKYDYIHITNLPVVKSDKEVVCPSASFKKNSYIRQGCDIDVIDYLEKIYDKCIFVFITNTSDTLYFSVIEDLEYFY